MITLPQAVYGCRLGGQTRGYHLLGKSPSLDNATIRELNRWCPSHGGLLDESLLGCSLNFHRLPCGRYVVSRTVNGEHEYSQRGGRQVMTTMLILEPRDLWAYHNNPLAVARVALSAGHLRWTRTTPPQLPLVKLPDHAPSESKLDSTANSTVNSESVAATPTAVPAGHEHDVRTRRVAPTGPTSEPESEHQAAALDQVLACLRGGNPMIITTKRPATEVVRQVLTRLPTDERPRLSFSTGLRPSPQRPYQLHVLAPAHVRQCASTLRQRPLISW